MEDSKRIAVLVYDVTDYGGGGSLEQDSEEDSEVRILSIDGEVYWTPGTYKDLGLEVGGIYVLEDTGKIDKYKTKVWRIIK